MKPILIILAAFSSLPITAQYPGDRAESSINHVLTRTSRQPIGKPAPNQARGGGAINDACADAITLTIHPYGNCPEMAIVGDNTDATQENPNICDASNSQIQDVWYTFTTGAEYSVIITLDPGAGMTDWSLGIYDGCDGAWLYCIGQPFDSNLLPLQPFTTYWLSVWSNNDFGTGGEFSLCIEAPPPPPANDVCSNATPRTMAVGDTWTFTGDATGAANTENIAYNSVWHAVTLTEPADLTIDFCGSEAFDLWGFFYRSIYLTCPPNHIDRVWAGSYDVTTCTDDRLTLCYAKLSAGTYYLPVAPPIEAGDGYSMHVRAEVYGSHVPSNDECAGAIPLDVNATCVPVNFLPECPTQSLPAIDCGAPNAAANDDVWYSFTAPSDLVTLKIDARSSMYSPTIDVYSGACGSLSAYDCADALGLTNTPQLTLTGLTPGEAYFFRIYNGQGTTPLDDASYDLCAVEGDDVGFGVEENRSTGAAGLFPNPNDSNFIVQVDPHAAAVQLWIFDMTGRAVFNERVAANHGRVHVRAASTLPSGLYTVMTSDGASVQQLRLIIR